MLSKIVAVSKFLSGRYYGQQSGWEKEWKVSFALLFTYRKALIVYFKGLGWGLNLDLNRSRYWDKDSRMGKWEDKQEKAHNKGHGMKPAVIVGEWHLSCWGNNGSQCETLTFRVFPPERCRSWGVGIPIAIRAAPVGQGWLPSCCSEQSRLPRLWRKPLDKKRYRNWQWEGSWYIPRWSGIWAGQWWGIPQVRWKTFLVYPAFKPGKSQTNLNEVVTIARGKTKRGTKATVWKGRVKEDDKNVLKWDSGDSFTILWIYENYCIIHFKRVSSMVCKLPQLKKKDSHKDRHRLME